MIWLPFSALCLLIRLQLSSSQENNVCKTLRDYRSIKFNKNCWFNPDLGSTTQKISIRHGYHTETHTVMTDDGYMLVLYRLTKNGTNFNKSRQPVLLQYGVGGAPEFWLLRGENSTAFLLSDQGYDVWLTNIRGSTSEATNEKLSKQNPKYWDYCFHENGIIDLPAMIDYISEITKNRQKLIYIGHSMGTTMSYVYAIERSKHSQRNLKGIISLAPVVTLSQSSMTYQVAGVLGNRLFNLGQEVGVYAIGESPSIREAIFIFCSTYPTILICDDILANGNGKAPNEAMPDLLPTFMSYFPTATSLKSLYHYAQMIRSKKFQKFDYGPLNKEKYNTTTPPKYDTDRISVPVHFFVGTNDAIATLPDVQVLYGRLKRNGINTTITILDYAHNDFFIGRNYQSFHKNLLNVLRDLSEIKK